MRVANYNYPTLILHDSFVSFLLRTAHDKASGKDSGEPEFAMKSQIKQLVAQIETGENAKKDGASGGDGPQPPGNAFMRMQRAVPIHPTHGMFGASSATSGW
jgi:hypothetical protein